MSSKASSSSSFDDDLELQALSYNAQEQQRRSSSDQYTRETPQQDDDGYHSDEDNFSQGSDEGERALLPNNSHANGEWQPPSSRPTATTWEQIKDIVLEAAPTLLLTTLSLTFTGKLLDSVTQWRAMQQVDQLIMIIPVILNLKGNLEMNLSARLGTAAHVGTLDDPQSRRSIILGNLSLLQAQADRKSVV